MNEDANRKIGHAHWKNHLPSSDFFINLIEIPITILNLLNPVKEAIPKSWDPLLSSRVRLRDRVAFWVDGSGQEAQAVLVDFERDRSFRMQVWQGWVLQRLDGRTTTREVLQEHAAGALSSEETLEWLDTMVRWLCANGMAEIVGSPMDSPPLAKSRASSLKRTFLKAGLMAASLVLCLTVSLLLAPQSRIWLAAHLLPAPTVAIPSIEPPLPPRNAEPIMATASGTLTEFLVKPGDVVPAGTEIARIVDLPAVAGLARMRDEIQRSREKRDEFFRSADDENYLQEVKHLAELAHELGERETVAMPTIIKSPFPGKIASLAFNLEGRSLTTGEAIATIIPAGDIRHLDSKPAVTMVGDQ
ncbi:MAG: hypothetical protein WBE58_12215 [Verrucomicrobiales bacterium]|nr:hypothetical protein [Verrucomicrobiales bacterium]